MLFRIFFYALHSPNIFKYSFINLNFQIRFLFDLIDDKHHGNFGRDELFEILEVMVGVNFQWVYLLKQFFMIWYFYLEIYTYLIILVPTYKSQTLNVIVGFQPFLIRKIYRITSLVVTPLFWMHYRQEQLALIVDRVVSEADKDNDGFINFEEFKNAINKLNVEEKMAFVGFK